eukprot:10412560-Karenia_brevis.AAC.1
MEHMPTAVAYLDVGGTLAPCPRQKRLYASQWTVPVACLEAAKKLHDAGVHLVVISRGDRTDDDALAT